MRFTLENEKLLGKFKYECGSKPSIKCIDLREKFYTFKAKYNIVIKVKRKKINEEITFANFRN